MLPPVAKLSYETIAPLYNYTACDISDALLKLKVPGAGFVPDLIEYSERKSKSVNVSGIEAPESGKITIAPASTVVFAPKNLPASTTYEGYGEPNVPKDKHWADMTSPGTIAVLSQPAGQKCAVLGGIMALRMKVLEAQGVVVLGRVRDVEELSSTGLPIWAYNTSTVGSGGEAKPHSVNVPIVVDSSINQVIAPGDIVFSDSINGVVVIPQDKLSAVIELLPRLVEADDRVKEDVQRGVEVKEAFRRHRSAL